MSKWLATAVSSLKTRLFGPGSLTQAQGSLKVSCSLGKTFHSYSASLHPGHEWVVVN